MSMERSIITMNEHGRIILPEDIAGVWMSEPELVELFGVIAPTLRFAIRAVYKSGVLKDYEAQRYIRLENGYNADVYAFPMIVALAFRINNFGAEKVRNAILERLYWRKEKTSIFFSLHTDSMTIPNYQA